MPPVKKTGFTSWDVGDQTRAVHAELHEGLGYTLTPREEGEAPSSLNFTNMNLPQSEYLVYFSETGW